MHRPAPAPKRFHMLKRIFGFLVGLAWVAMALAALRYARDGRDAGHADLDLWWSVIAALLAIAALAAVIGTLVHMREKRRGAPGA